MWMLRDRVQGQQCKEDPYSWMIQAPVDQTGSYSNIHHETRSNASTKSINGLKNLFQPFCTSSPDLNVSLTILPRCMNVTITRTALKFLDNQIQTTINSLNITIEDTISFCYPLSPQILNCPLIYYEKNCYEIHRKTQHLHVFHTNYRLQLGDYFTDHQGKAFSCSEPLPTPVSSLRCNYVTLDAGQFTILPNDSLYINESHKLIQRPIYATINQNSVNVCYPLSIEFLNCPKTLLYIIRKSQYDVLPGKSLFYRSHNQVADPSQYYQYNEFNDVILCVTQQSMKLCNLLLNIYVGCYLLSIVFLILLTIYYLVIPKQIIYKLCLVGHSAAMICYYAEAIVERIIDGHDSSISCYIFFFLKYFSFASAYTWITALAFDICSSFSSLVTSYCQRKMLIHQRQAILIYNILCWGIPFSMCVLVAIVELDTDLQKSLSIYPTATGSCKCLCWLSNRLALFITHYGYHMCLSTINIILYVITVYNIRQDNMEAKTVNCNRRKQM